MEVTGGRALTLDQRIGHDASVSKEDLREIGKRVGSRLTNEAGFGSRWRVVASPKCNTGVGTGHPFPVEARLDGSSTFRHP